MHFFGSNVMRAACATALSLGLVATAGAQDTLRTRDTTRLRDTTTVRDTTVRDTTVRDTTTIRMRMGDTATMQMRMTDTTTRTRQTMGVQATSERRIPVQKREAFGDVELRQDTRTDTSAFMQRSQTRTELRTDITDTTMRDTTVRDTTVRDTTVRDTTVRDTTGVTIAPNTVQVSTSASQDTIRSGLRTDTLTRTDTLVRTDTLTLTDTLLRSDTLIVRTEAVIRDSISRANPTISAAELDALVRAERARLDSLATAETARRDSLTNAETMRRDSITLAERARSDSLMLVEQQIRSGQQGTRRLPSGWYIALAAGLTEPRDDFDELGYDRGFNVTIPIGYHKPGNLLGVRLDLAYSQFNGGPFNFSTPGPLPSLDNGDPQVYSAALNLTAKFPFNEARTTGLYLLGGGGVYVFREFGRNSALGAFLGNDVLDPNDSDNETTINKFGWNVGAGFEFGLGNLGLFVESRLVNVIADRGDDLTFREFFGDRSDNVRWMPLVLGLTIR